MKKKCKFHYFVINHDKTTFLLWVEKHTAKDGRDVVWTINNNIVREFTYEKNYVRNTDTIVEWGWTLVDTIEVEV